MSSDGVMERVYRLSPPSVQNVLVSGYRYLRRPIEYGGLFREWRARLEETQWWTREELEAWQFTRVRALLDHAYMHVPAYRRLYDEHGVHPNDFKSLSDLAKFPIVSKQLIREAPASFVASDFKRYRPVQLNTSGTTGSPFQFYSNRETETIEWAFNWRHKSWGGARLWEPMFSLGGKVTVPIEQTHPPFWRTNRAEGIHWLSGFHMTPENLDLYIEHISRSGIRFIRGYPSNLTILAQHLQRRDLRLNMLAAYTGSEPLYSHARELIEDRFGCKVFDWYGVTERVVTASQCNEHLGYHVHMENTVVEILRGEGPVEAGQIGEIVGTCLSNYAMPLIRYRTGDLSSYTADSCACGRGLATLSQVLTKKEHVLVTADGRWISPSVLTHPFKPIKGIQRSQIVQTAPSELLVRVVPEPEFDEHQQEQLRKGFAERLGNGMHVSIETVQDIPRDPSGKFRWVVSNVPIEINEMLDRQA